ncbi:serine acetyltransferase [Enterobacter wuhouensis]|jgi:serine acetyltransferase|uniref:Acetyltransferase n=2 Tax=Enterobacter wuhouensis TaxID=2529381 RepID=A0A4R0GF36_9ENTR|nr:serine acetyltransferase [Enterobacter wuhouensis]
MYLNLTECLKEEVQKGSKSFSWARTIRRAIKCKDRRFYFWYRIWTYFYQTNKYGLSHFAKNRMSSLNRKYSIDINPKARIGAGMKIVHFSCIVMRGHTVIGKNAVIRQGVTIGARRDEDVGFTTIGDNVEIGANSCILGDISVGHNVTIGALTFINKDIPDNSVVYSSKEMFIRSK